MNHEPLASIDDLLVLLGREDETPVDSGDAPADYLRLEQALDLASNKIRGETRQILTEVEDDTFEVRGTWASLLWLPERPVTDITSITLSTGATDLDLPVGTFTFSPDGEVRIGRADDIGLPVVNWPDGTFGFGGPNAILTFVYNHGYSPDNMPGELHSMCLELASRQVTQPVGGSTSLTVGHYSETFGRDRALQLSDEDLKVCRRYRPVAGTVAATAY